MRKIILVLVAAAFFAGCQGAPLCGPQLPDPFSAYAEAPQTPDPWLLERAPSIQLTRRVYDKDLTFCNLGEDWFASYQPVLESERGTEYVTGFLTEPAFLSRRLTYESDIASGNRDSWMYTSLDFALTRRLQVSGTMPLNLDDDDDDVPFGRVGGRALLCDVRGFLASANVDIDFNSRATNVTPTISVWYDLANVGFDYWALNGTAGIQMRDDRGDLFTATAGLSHSFAVGTTGRWDAILEAGVKNDDWMASLGFVKPLDFISPDIDLRGALIRNLDDGYWTVNVGFAWNF